jgi:hypothetical protein
MPVTAAPAARAAIACSEIGVSRRRSGPNCWIRPRVAAKMPPILAPVLLVADQRKGGAGGAGRFEVLRGVRGRNEERSERPQGWQHENVFALLMLVRP